MELRQLYTFKVVAEVKGFTRAAEILGYAQSSVTAQIQALEEELGTPLFDRLGKKIMLTSAGERLLPHASEMIQMHDLAKSAIQSPAEVSGTLTIGAPESLAAFRLPAVIQEYRSLYPEVKIILKPGVCWEMRGLVRRGDLDLAFLLEPEVEEPDLQVDTLVYEKIALVAPPDHPFVQKKAVVPEDLKNETLLHTEPGCSYRTLIEKHLNSHGVFPNPDLEFWSIEAIKNCVMSGLGLSFLPLIAVRNELDNRKLSALAWDDSSHQIATQLVYHKKKWLSPALRQFLLLTVSHAENWCAEELIQK
ncbi:LysR family transcriptional regulator [Aneurinibacillus sp. Ricciae_BoGa-3]|uniref:LysR family transcriptional regulator n=1 Tax=Aneurinibacillus sp. Ricciae_BoGa-3 TaxID=3022697 RepID=UPI0023401664|nr:LysR family transcriptional regulator [Aneurinibacillus sp. Ricciae_BoGa-3]WCK53740.1 LysR family transcriptional regulator [Aneurinibacillus sp. Ricciae_BoGa-3]